MSETRSAPPAWMRHWLRAAAAYNVLWGLYAILLPTHYFTWAGLEAPRYPQLWQCIGMIVGVYGIGYWVAARDPLRHWPIVLVGLLGKIFGPLGFLWALLTGALPWSFAWTLLTNDLIWWVPFAMMLWAAARAGMAPERELLGAGEDRATLLRSMTSSKGKSLRAHSDEAPQLLVFLRHFGCIFCREALADLGKRRAAIEDDGTEILIVHMGTPEEGEEHLEPFGLDGCAHVSDPSSSLYRAFRLERGRFGQLFGPATWLRGLRAMLAGHFVGKNIGDGFQMPGVFLLHRGELLKEFRHAHAGEVPDYRELGACPISG